MITTTVYLLCFAPGIPKGSQRGHARHYLGSCAGSPEDRLVTHLAGLGSPLVSAAVDAGLDVEIVRTWAGSRQLERQLKRRKNLPALCPRCRGDQLLEHPEILVTGDGDAPENHPTAR
jgi:hypothetical protein